MPMTDPVEAGEGGAVVRSEKERKLIEQIVAIVTRTPPLNMLWPVNQAITFENYMKVMPPTLPVPVDLPPIDLVPVDRSRSPCSAGPQAYCKLDTTHANIDHDLDAAKENDAEGKRSLAGASGAAAAAAHEDVAA